MAECAKARHRLLDDARTAARVYAMQLNRAGETCGNLYAYRCQPCRAWHTTRRSEWDGVPLMLVHAAKPTALQEWAMGTSDRARARARTEYLRRRYPDEHAAIEAVKREAFPSRMRRDKAD